MFSISRLQSVMKGLPRGQFDALVKAHGADKHRKGFSSWDQLLGMVYGHLSGAESLRVIEAGFNSQALHHYHLGSRSMKRSTLADANSRSSPTLFAAVAERLMAQASRQLRREGERCLYLLDSTSITLNGRGFDHWTATTRSHNQGIKLHVLYSGHDQVPQQHSLSAVNVNDVTEALKLPIEAGAVYVFDKGYCDYNWWADIHDQGATFVTRFKRNAALRVERTLPVPATHADTILSDEIVCFSNPYPGGSRRNRYTAPLRRIVVARPEHDSPMVLATNDLDSAATDMAQHYKDRWQVELFFKWIKQHLKIKRFLGRSQNAVHIQILCALIAYLLLAMYRKTHCIHTSMWLLLAELRATLFQRPERDATLHRRRCRRQAELTQRQAPLFI